MILKFVSLFFETQQNENVTIDSRPHSSGFNSFLRWFKRNEKVREEKTKRSYNNNNSHNNNNINRLTSDCTFNESCETLSPAATPILGRKSTASSCDSVFSTATTGFAFVPPTNYRPYGDACQVNNLSLFYSNKCCVNKA